MQNTEFEVLKKKRVPRGGMEHTKKGVYAPRGFIARAPEIKHNEKACISKFDLRYSNMALCMLFSSALLLIH